MTKIPEDLFEALKVFQAEDAEDIMVYIIRDTEGKGWDGPRIAAWASACDTMKRYLEGVDDG